MPRQSQRAARAAGGSGGRAAHRADVRPRRPGSRSATRDGKTLLSQLNPAGSEQVGRGQAAVRAGHRQRAARAAVLRRPAGRPRAARQGRRRALHARVSRRRTRMTRRTSAQVQVGDVAIGGGAPVVVQSMTNTDTADADATARQVLELWRAPARSWCASPSTRRRPPAQVAAHPRAARRAGLRRAAGRRFPFQRPQAADRSIRTAREALAKYRINPGNVGKGAKRDDQFAHHDRDGAARTASRCASASTGAASIQELLARMMDENAQRGRSRWTPTR